MTASRLWADRAVPNICARMMLGLSLAKYPDATPEQKKQFEEDHKELLSELIPLLSQTNSSIGAAAACCALRFGKERPLEFLKNLKERTFQGKQDPVYLFFMWFKTKKVKNKGAITYAYALKACRAYCEHRTLTHLRPAKVPLFAWDANWKCGRPNPESENE